MKKRLTGSLNTVLNALICADDKSVSTTTTTQAVETTRANNGGAVKGFDSINSLNAVIFNFKLRIEVK